MTDLTKLNSMIEKAFARLEAAGILVRTGFQPDADGELRPAYATASSLGLMSEQEEQRRMRLLTENDDVTVPVAVAAD
jgi:hypothetical protein